MFGTEFEGNSQPVSFRRLTEMHTICACSDMLIIGNRLLVIRCYIALICDIMLNNAQIPCRTLLCERHLGAIFSIQKSLSEDAIKAPSKMDGSPLPGAQEGGSTSLKWCQGVGCSGHRGALADDDAPGPGPGIEPRGIRGLAAVVRSQHQVNRLGLGLGDQLDEPQLIKVAGEQKVPAPMRNVKHQAAGVVRGFGVPVWWRMEHRELRRALVPG